MKKILFIHRSVGKHLLEQGNLRGLLANEAIELDDYDNNTGILTYSDGSERKDQIIMPGNNTNPVNLSEFFQSWPSILDGYDLIMIKSCYPNSHIKDQSQLELVKGMYQSIFSKFDERNKQLLLITTPPLRPIFTNKLEAELSSQLADWLTKKRSNRVEVFDLHHLYSEPKGKHKGMLRQAYRRLAPWDNHPNKKAHQAAAPMLVELIAQNI